MSDLRNRYKQILKELEEHIEDEKERRFVTQKFQELSVVFMDIIDRLTYITDIRVKEVEERQKEIEEQISTVQKTVDGIENDIYEDEELYDFEIVCPYCTHDFVADINSDINTEIECPECHNIIELDWNGEEDHCEHECSCCGHECMENTEMIYENEEQKSEKKYNKQKQEVDNQTENEDEDM